MRAVLVPLLSLVILAANPHGADVMTATAQTAMRTAKVGSPGDAAEFDRLRNEAHDALYNMDYKAARAG